MEKTIGIGMWVVGCVIMIGCIVAGWISEHHKELL